MEGNIPKEILKYYLKRRWDMCRSNRRWTQAATGHKTIREV